MRGDGDAARAATRERIIEATLRCVERWGLAKTSLEDVAVAADLSRATVYRHFPGGRDELVQEALRFEVEQFLSRVACEVSDDRGIEAKLVHALITGHRALDEHRLLHQVLSTEREALLSELAAIEPFMLAEVQAEMRRNLDDAELRPGVDPDDAADYLARIFFSYVGSPGGSDLTDPAAVTALVRRFLLGGILAPAARPAAD
jgi:AcrR family transcriptional regulator